MTPLNARMLEWASALGERLALLAEATGSVEGWLRAEAIIAAKAGRFGETSSVQGEVDRDDLTLTTLSGTARIEFKVAWNNKNLFDGYNGTRGVREDIAKLRACAFDEKFVVVFLCFFDRRVFEDLGRFYHAKSRSAGVALQPAEGEDFHKFADTLAGKVVGSIVNPSASAATIFADDGRWFGAWVHQVV